MLTVILHLFCLQPISVESLLGAGSLSENRSLCPYGAYILIGEEGQYTEEVGYMMTRRRQGRQMKSAQAGDLLKFEMRGCQRLL